MKKILILASHGKMAEGVANSMSMIIGATENVLAMGLMPGQNPAEISEKIRDILCEDKERQVIVVADLQGGSVSNALMNLTSYANMKLINGLNLGLAISLYLTEGYLCDEEIEAIVEESKECIGFVKIISAENDEEII